MIAQTIRLHDAVCKWAASLDTYLPQRAVPSTPEFFELDEDELLEFEESRLGIVSYS